MFPRYSKPEMAALFEQVATWQAVTDVELEAVKARFTLGQIPSEDYYAVIDNAPIITAEIVAEIDELEKTTDHDVAAFVDTIHAHINNSAARWFHYGLTSSDVIDTAQCLRLKKALDLLCRETSGFVRVLCQRAREFANTPTAGRTHGQHAEIITFGVRLTNWAQMVDRALVDLQQAGDAIAVGKLSGACGTYSNIDPRVEQMVCDSLGLTPILATQVIPRDLHAEVLTACARLGNAIGHIFLNERVMALTEVGEVEEGRRAGQKGSSAMPHKKNPIKGEQLCGLARVLRGYCSAAQENVELLFERDISHSAPERIILADALILAHYMVVTARRVTEALVVKPGVMRDNINRTYGLMFSQTALTALIDQGWGRDDAYRLIQQLAMKAFEDHIPLRTLLEKEEGVKLSPDQLDRIFDEGPMLAHVPLIMERLPQ